MQNSLQIKLSNINTNQANVLTDCLQILQEPTIYTLENILDRINSEIEDDPLLEENQLDSDSSLVIQQCHLNVIKSTTILLLNESIDFLISLTSSIPRYIDFWNKQQKRRFQAKIEMSPLQWILNRNAKFKTSNKIRILEETLDVHLKTIGLMRRQVLKLYSVETDEQTMTSIKEAFQLITRGFNDRHLLSTVSQQQQQQQQQQHLLDEKNVVSSSLKKPPHITEPDLQTLISSLGFYAKRVGDIRVCHSKYKTSYMSVLNEIRPPSNLQRNWLLCSLIGCGTVFSLVYLKNRRHQLRELAVTTRLSLMEFASEHVLRPLSAIVGEIFFNKKTEIQDPSALVDSVRSLQSMLGDFIKDARPDMPIDLKEKAVQDMDMSVVSFQYEKEISKAFRNILSGDIVRMILIQVQFIKKELMVAIGAIDQLMAANHMNLQVMATIPAFLVVGIAYKVVSTASFSLVGFTLRRWSNPKVVGARMRRNIRDIRRLLNLSHQFDDLNWRKQNDSKDAISTNDSRSKQIPLDRCATLCDRELGLLLVLLAELKQLFEKNRICFSDEEQELMQEDLDDLVKDGVLVPQQLETIQRMCFYFKILKQ